MSDMDRQRGVQSLFRRTQGRPGRWITAAGIFLIAVLWLVAMKLVQQDRDDEVRGVFLIQTNVAKAMETSVRDVLEDADAILHLLKRLHEKQGSISGETRDLLKTTNSSRYMRQAAVLDPRGHFLFSFRPDVPGVNLADRPYFQAHVTKDDGAVFIGQVVVGRVTGVPSFHMSRRINHPDGSFRGVVALALGCDFFSDVFSRITLEKMHFVLFGSDGAIRAVDAESASLLGKNVVGGTIFREFQKAPDAGSFVDESLLLKKRRLISYRAVSGYPLVIGVAVDEDVALSRFNERRRIYIGSAVLFSWILIGIMFLLYRMQARQARLSRTILREKERAEKYLQLAGSLIIALDDQGRVTLTNRRVREVLGYTEDDLAGRDWFEAVIPAENRDSLRERFWAFLRGAADPGQEAVDVRTIGKDGSLKVISWSSHILKDEDGHVLGALSSGTDVTERRRLEVELLRLATTDPLTGLSNRRSFLENGRREFETFRRYKRPLSLLMLDIDHFKQVNDTHGHSAGDQVLVALAGTVHKVLRTIDLCGRFGGEEFVCLLPDTPADKAFGVAERLRMALEERAVEIPSGVLHFTVSIGVATSGPDSASLDELIHQADEAMYQAKQAGRNRVVAG